ncbi:MAG TPA: VOC family protein [Solirubrobacteraceae bacterium]|nr:VOC family protein [Solirubrobacteraceae bacterium]
MTIRVPDRGASEQFFETVLAPLGIDTTYRTREFTEWQEFMVAQATPTQPATNGLHLAFAAPSREQVDAFWQAGIDAGYGDDGPPGPRPHYRKDYYGGFLRDPSSNSIEAVHYEASRRRGRIIDHLWLRVADLPASRRFYELAGEAAGFELRSGDEDQRATFGRAPGTPSFSLVAGTATRNLHIAFPGDDDAVRRFHAGAVAAGYRSNGGPGERARYHPGYYAAYVLDPDGNNIEVVDHHRD